MIGVTVTNFTARSFYPMTLANPPINRSSSFLVENKDLGLALATLVLITLAFAQIVVTASALGNDLQLIQLF
jgi:hypothetical protein